MADNGNDHRASTAQCTVGVENRSFRFDRQEFSETLKELRLQMVTIGDWILLQRAAFDFHVKEEPYHSIQIYVNLRKMTYIRRVWGISERSGTLQGKEDLKDLCIVTFKKSKVCLGYVGPDPCRLLELVKVKYPFTRWISSACYITYGKQKDSGNIGLCSACSRLVEQISRIHVKKETGDECIPQLDLDIKPNDLEADQEIKYKEEDVSEDVYNIDDNNTNESTAGSGNEDGFDEPGLYELDGEAISDEDYDDKTIIKEVERLFTEPDADDQDKKVSFRKKKQSSLATTQSRKAKLSPKAKLATKDSRSRNRLDEGQPKKRIRNRRKPELQTCEQCGVTLSSKGRLDHHIKVMHGSYADREHKCDFPGCTKAFVSTTELKHHKAYHGERDFICDHCGKSYWHKWDLVSHLRRDHKALPQLKLKCKHCDEVF